MTQKEHSCSFNKGLTWWTFSYLEDRLSTVTRFITIDKSNKDAWSEELASLLILSGSAMDTFFRNMKDCPYLIENELCVEMDTRVAEREKEGGFGLWTIDEYRDAYNPIFELSENKVNAPFGLRRIMNIQPFKAFSKKNVPKWWTAYNGLKHDYYDKIENATLNNVLNCMAGLLILNTLHICSRDYLISRRYIKDTYDSGSQLRYELTQSYKGVPSIFSNYDFSIKTKQFVYYLRAVD